jgi:predicted O-methyltransferase YrrM
MQSDMDQKIEKMDSLNLQEKYGLSNVPTEEDFGKKFYEGFIHFVNLQEITRAKYLQVKEGSYLARPPSDKYDKSMFLKQALLYRYAKNANNVLEVGVHAGHSLLIMLLANPNLKIIAVDPCFHDHTKECVSYLNIHFNGAINLMVGRSKDVLPKLSMSFDLIHIDGDHSYKEVVKDLRLAHRLSGPESIFIFDDYKSPFGVKWALWANEDLLRVIESPDCIFANAVAIRSEMVLPGRSFWDKIIFKIVILKRKTLNLSIFFIIDRQIGRFGIFLKRSSPKLYYCLKSFFNPLKK